MKIAKVVGVTFLAPALAFGSFAAAGTAAQAAGPLAVGAGTAVRPLAETQVVTDVVPLPPQFDPPGSVGFVAIPSVNNVTYYAVDQAGVRVAIVPGLYPINAINGTKITAEPTVGHHFSHGMLTEWRLPNSASLVSFPPPPPTFNPTDRTYTIPSMPHAVEFVVNGIVQAAGTYSAKGQKVGVIARSLPGFILSSPASWNFEFSPVDVKPEAPAFNQAAGTYTIPSVPGVEYLVNGSIKTAGNYLGNDGPVTIRARALSGYALTDSTEWSFDFTPPIIAVTATAPAFNKAAGSITLPDVPGVQYSVNGANKAPGTYSGYKTKVTVTATALAGYSLAKSASWSYDFTPSPQKVTAAAPVFSKSTGKYTIPGTKGVQYYVNGKAVKAGSYSANPSKVAVTARALSGYVLAAPASWSYDFTPVRVTAPPAGFSAKARTYTIPARAGVRYYANGKAVAAGTHKAGRAVVTVTAKASGGYVLTGTISWKYDFRTKAVPAKPSFSGKKNSYTIPKKQGVKYYVDGRYKPAGTYRTSNGKKLKFTARASSPSYRLSGTASWTYRF